ALRDPANGLRNVVVLSGAAGGTLASELRLQTLEPGGAIGTGVREFATGRSHTGLLGARSSAGAWRLMLHGALPTGIGVGCTALTTTSYARVTASKKALTVTLRDARRKPVLHDDDPVQSLTGSGGPGSTSVRPRIRRRSSTPPSRPASTPVISSRFSATTTSAVAPSM